MTEELNKQAINILGNDYYVTKYNKLHLLYRLGKVIFMTDKSSTMEWFIKKLSVI